MSSDASTPASMAPVSSVETTAMIGSDSSRMLSNIFLGSVEASRPAMKIATTASLNEAMNANSAPTSMPGFSTGSVTHTNVCSGLAPELIAARSRLRSNPLRDAVITRNDTGIASATAQPESKVLDRLQEAAGFENAALEKLEKLLEKLAEWDNFQSVLVLTRDLLNGQKNLQERTRASFKEK